ncbi:MAG: CHAT domain-containing protein [Saprospiraceae bacterium]|nr:CHAT domain-containing protein [Saprospiraceae bacterium]
MIVADDELHRLSFDALAMNFKRELAINQHSFSYLIHIDRCTGPKTKVKITNDNTALFSFSDPETIKEGSNSDVPELGGTYKEVTNIAQKLQLTHKYCGLNATKIRFMNYYENKKINHIHLAVHGYADEKKQHLAYLLFRNDSNTTFFDTVYTYDIEAMNASVQSVILSACQTHYGKIMHQEGTITLARSFLNNGAHQVISTLWVVDDQSTAHMMDHIYKDVTEINLNAVHEAKRNMYQSGKYSIDQWAGIQLIR